MVASPILYSSTRRFRPILHALRAEGVDVASALKRAGFTEAELLDPGCRVPRERVVALTGELMCVSPCPAMGVRAAEHFVLSDLGVLGYLAQHAATPRAALDHIARFQRLIADAADIRIVGRGDRVTLRAGLRAERPTVSPAADFTLGTLVQMVRLLSDGQAQPLAVRLPRTRPGDLTHYRRVLGRHLDFDAEQAELVYAAHSLEVRCPAADPQLADILASHAQMLIDRLPAPRDLVEQVRGMIEGQLRSGDLSLPGIAAELGVSERTLRRRLSEQGSSFREVLDRARLDHATKSLNEGRLSLTEIAVNVGFADATAFTRSFRRWTGKRPSEVVRPRPLTARYET